MTQDVAGLDVSVFRRVFLSSASPIVGEQHASYLLPIWMEKDWDKWSAFGGGGCEINRGGTSQDFCGGALEFGDTGNNGKFYLDGVEKNEIVRVDTATNLADATGQCRSA